MCSYQSLSCRQVDCPEAWKSLCEVQPDALAQKPRPQKNPGPFEYNQAHRNYLQPQHLKLSQSSLQISPSSICKIVANMADTTPLSHVKIEALVVSKLTKHCAANPTSASGAIVGMDNGSTLEITNAFPFPTADNSSSDSHDAPYNNVSAAPRSKANQNYQNEMIKMLKEVNVDANNVGWYTSANLGNFVTSSFIENQFHYQSQPNERSVALVHDVSRSAQGALSMRAFRLSKKFMDGFTAGTATFTTEAYVGLYQKSEHR